MECYVVWAELIKKKLTIDNIKNTILKAHSIYLALLEFYTTLFYFIFKRTNFSPEI